MGNKIKTTNVTAGKFIVDYQISQQNDTLIVVMKSYLGYKYTSIIQQIRTKMFKQIFTIEIGLSPVDVLFIFISHLYL